MPTLPAIREPRRSERLSALRQGARGVAAAFPQSQVWLFGSLARGDWDADSGVDLLAIAPAKPEAEALADAVLAMTLDRCTSGRLKAPWNQAQWPRSQHPTNRCCC